MNKMLVAVFDNEPAAYEGLAALKDLHRSGDITLYSSAVIAKTQSGDLAIKDQADPGPVGSALGLLTGTLLGVLSGPVGLAVGATVGGLSGLLVDINRTGVDLAFLEEVAGSLTEGKTAVLAEVEESWTTPVDTRLGAQGGVVFRRLRGEVIEDQLARESASLQADLKGLKREFNTAAAQDRMAIHNDIARVKSQLEATRSRAKARLDQLKVETAARVQTLEDQAKSARGLTKARIDRRISDVKAGYEVRSRKLHRAWTLTKEALAA